MHPGSLNGGQFCSIKGQNIHILGKGFAGGDELLGIVKDQANREVGGFEFFSVDTPQP
jgi:hypothetical protein